MSTRILCCLLATLVWPILLLSQAAPPATTANEQTIACRALEAHTDDGLKVTMIIFHQRDEAQRPQLAELLRNHSGEMVEVQAGDGTWQRARMVRLKSCFGRGLLFLAAPGPISEHSEFLLRRATK